MKYITENISETNKLALSMMLYSTCGEDEETMRGTEIEQIAPDIFHITYNLNDPMDAMDFHVAVSKISGTTFKYWVFKSVYADDGSFTLTIR